MLLLCNILPDQVEIRREGQGTRGKVSQWAIKCRTKSRVLAVEKYESVLAWEINLALLISFHFIFFTVFQSMISTPDREQESCSPWGIFYSPDENCAGCNTEHRCVWKIYYISKKRSMLWEWEQPYMFSNYETIKYWFQSGCLPASVSHSSRVTCLQR